MQSVTIQVRIYPTDAPLLRQLGNEYIRVVNSLTEQAESEQSFPKVTTKDVDTILPSAVCNQAIRDAKSVYRKCKVLGTRPVLRKRVYYVNNQNYSIGENTLAFPIVVDGKVKKTAFRAKLTTRDRERLATSKCGLLRVVEKSGKWYAQVSLELETQGGSEGISIGVDLGIKVPAVAVTSTGKNRFFGNGRQNKFVRRKFSERRRRLGKLKKLSAIRKQRNKEQRWMRDQNHKISRQIVNLAIQENVSLIKLEKLANIRKTTRTSRKNNHSLHSWTFYQLSMFIVYKAKLVGIQVAFVDPEYTSQTCPACGTRNHAKDRRYQCSCGFTAHRDRIAAINILHVPVNLGVAS